MALNLFYLLFAYSQASYAQELEAMSVALRIFHANPIVRSAAGASVAWELTLTLEHRTYDELSRLWQATTAPLRMSLVYRAAVVLIDPDGMPAAAPQATTVSVLGAAPGHLPVADNYPVLFATSREGAYVGPDGKAVSLSSTPACVAAGQSTALVGANLGVKGVSDNVYMLAPGDEVELNVTNWAQTAESSASKFVLGFPSAGETPPADPATPDPGVYQLRVGSGELGSAGATRSGFIPISVAAYVNPAGGPVLKGVAPFTITGTGFIPGSTVVLVGTVALSPASAAPGPGQVSVAASGTSFTFSPPPGPAGTVVPLRVRVNGIEADPALWVTL
jgi:hypothetical protein